ncbi:hypothetical protein ACQPZ8_01795 [Actinomadura nitritigenes]|uniref:hypothetical protein n=1 Tax=Actinomadura nitritigenes TaxID=134602 RepID=UPI003D91172A
MHDRRDRFCCTTTRLTPTAKARDLLRRPSRFYRATKRIAPAVQDLDLPAPWDLHEFLTRWDQRRGRTTKLLPLRAGEGVPTGLTFSAGDTDYLWHVDTSPVHRDHIVMHEVGHLVFDHQPSYEVDAELLARLMGSSLTHLSTGAARLMLGARTGFATIEEREAEMFSWLALVRAGERPESTDGSTLHATWGRG